jgi:uncharacterized membrane protein
MDPFRNKPSSGKATIANLVSRNIQALVEMRQDHERRRTFEEKIAAKITKFTGSMPFVYAHILLLLLWISVNTGLYASIKPFDPFPFSMLAIFASIEAIFLTAFVLISENRSSILSERRSDLNLQINLLSEQEVTKIIEMVDAISRHLNVPVSRSSDTEGLKEKVEPEFVLKKIEEAEDRSNK